MSADRWPRAYRPLRPLSLVAQIAVLAVAEVGLYYSYAAHDARFHWATHFLVGLIAAALWQSVHLVIAARPSRLQIVSVLLFHLAAMWPDLVFRIGEPHEHWMDWLALGHISVHYLPGGDTSWLVLALLAAGGYAFLLSRWLMARHAEAAAGLSPAIGIGGGGVIRSQLDPRTHQLVHEHLEPDVPGRAGDPIVLLHGLGATVATWLPAGRALAETGESVLVPDLLGFGSSLRLGTRFHLADQAEAVVRLLDHHDITRVHLVGHSWGCVVAAAVAARAPERVERLTLVSPAAFADPQAARDRFGKRSMLARMTIDSPDLASLVCGAMCLLRPAFARVAPRIEPDVPASIAVDSVRHYFPSYRDALESIWRDNPVPALLRAPTHPVTVVLGEQDDIVHPDDVLDLSPDPSVRIERVDGTHYLPFEDPATTARLIRGVGVS